MKSVYLYLVIYILFLSCSNDDDSNTNDDFLLNGQFSLVNVSGGLLGIDDDFEIGLIIWDFDGNNWILTVDNNNTANSVCDGLPSGTYNYQILTTTGENDYLVIDGMNLSYGITSSESAELILDEGVALDGFLLSFNRH